MEDDASHRVDARAWVHEHAADFGFSAVGIASAHVDGALAAHLAAFLAEGAHGDMAWMAESEFRRAHPQRLWRDARSVVMLGLSYAPADDPLRLLAERDRATISVYARGKDYHDVVKPRLKRFARALMSRYGGDVKIFVDTAPVMEKPLAEAAGIGWQGKHTNLVSRDHGSWLFLGAVFTTLEIEPDTRHADRCGSCRQCLDICPTDAFPAPYRLDARRCISYLTIEHKGHIPNEFRRPMGNRIYGCDDCLAVCPWNKFAETSRESRLFARAELGAPLIGDLLGLDDESFRKVFAGSPIKRIGRDRFIRNVLIAAGNSDDESLVPPVRALLGDPSPLVRAMAVWALSQLLGRESFTALRDEALSGEKDDAVRAEWQRGYSPS